MRTGRVLPFLVLAMLLADPALAEKRSLRALTDFLAHADGATDHVAVASALDELRAMKRNAAPAAETLSGLLPHRTKLYRDRDKTQVVRLRAYIVLTLSEIGYPASAEWALLDTLANLDDRITSREIGAAARAARSLGPRGRELTPYLLEALTLAWIGEEEFSLERYDTDFARAEATTIQLEVVRALAALATPGDREVLRVLRQLSESRATEAPDLRVVREAQRAVETIEGGVR